MSENGAVTNIEPSKSLKRPRSPSLDQDHRILDISTRSNHTALSQTSECKFLKLGDVSDVDSDSIANDLESDSIIRRSKTNMFHHDPRRRRDALSNLLKFSNDLDFTLYSELSETLHDDYEQCRWLMIQLILNMSSKYGDCLVFQKGTDEQIRLEDDAFVKICRMITDSDVRVRTQAARTLKEFKSVGLDFLLATLDKKLDGAFVFGLEDERKDVRIAALESLCQLSKREPKFAEISIDHIVDMFNDEIEDIRLKAIQCLQEIDNIALREDQVEIILTVLDSPLMDIREALHTMIAKVNITSARSLRRCIETILYNLARYPQDKLSIFNCFKLLGQNLSELVHSLVNELLAIHPYLKLPEHSLIDDNYIATLILIFNAASKTPAIYDSLETHTLQHQTYVRHTLSNFMPMIEAPVSQSATAAFFIAIFERISKMLRSKNSLASKISLMEMSLHDLKRFGLVENEFKAATDFYRIIIESILIISQVLTTPDWSELNSSLILIRQVLNQTFCLQKVFNKMSPLQKCCIQQLRIQALAIELVVYIKCSNMSALDLCEDFIEEVSSLEAFLEDEPFLDSIAMGDLSCRIPEEVNSLGDEKQQPVSVAKRLEPLFSKTSFSLNQIYETLVLMIQSQNIEDLRRMKAAKATVNTSIYRNDTPYKYTLGLVLELTLDAFVENITDIDDVRIKVTYPDRQSQIVVPIANHFRLTSTDGNSGTSSYRLYSTVKICQSTCANPSSVDVSIVFDYRDNQSTSLDQNNSKASERNEIIELCKPFNLKVQPQNIRW